MSEVLTIIWRWCWW